MARTALLTGTPGALLEAIAAALAGAGYAPRHVPMGTDGSLRLEVPPGGASLVVHVGLRSGRALPERARADAEAAAASGAAELALASGARRLVHVSTVGVYGRPRNLPCREGELKAPRTAEERIRWHAEQASWAAFRRGAPLTVLRPAAVYGPTLRGGPVRALSLFALFAPRGGRVPIIRRGPVAHLVHLDDVARAAVHVASHPDDGAVLGRAFNVADEAPLPLSEHLETALAALGYRPGRILPAFPRFTGALLWLFRHVPDHALLDRVNRRLDARWLALATRTGTAPSLAPRIDREALHWIAADHYYDTSRLARIGWRALHPVSTPAVVETIRALLAQRLLPGTGRGALPAW
ncbi:MAG TPA: NAD(P)-dependent oxidoreductase [Anaeromyxobacter sp.]